MEPRLFSRGNTRVIACNSPLASGLQWSRGFSAAEIRQVIASPELTALLQWSRGFSAAEMDEAGTPIDLTTGASMEPRLFSRGNFRQD